MKREAILKRPAYWFEHEQNELYRQVTDYMKRENINRTELAKRLNVSKGYVSQILNGNFNYTLKKWIELCLAIGVVPKIEYASIDDVLKKDLEKKTHHEDSATKERDDFVLIKKEDKNTMPAIAMAPTSRGELLMKKMAK